MPFLLYCVAPGSAAETTVNGVGGAAVRSSMQSGLKFFFSEIPADDSASRDIVQAAQQVHAVVSDVFSRGPVLPFRYPTIMAGVRELEELATTRSERFREYFQRVGNQVQMDVRLSLGPERGKDAANSGRAYLERRARCQAQLSAAAEKCRQGADSADWRSYQSAENIRCQALISRVEVISFYERMRALKLPEGVEAAVSGPWPPAGFWEDEPR